LFCVELVRLVSNLAEDIVGSVIDKLDAAAEIHELRVD
jgi:hypothetical protein